MSVQGLTLSQLEDQIAENLMGIRFINSAMTANGSSTTLVDTGIPGGLDAHNGAWVLFESGANDGLEREVTDDDGAGTLTVGVAVTSTVSGDTYKLFDREGRYRSSLIRSAVNRAITLVQGKYYKDEESFALYGDGRTNRFPLPTEFQLVDRIAYRDSVWGKPIHTCETAFDESVDSDITVTVDTETKLGGTGSCKFVVAGTVSDGDIASDDISSLDLSGMTHVELWIRCATAVASGDLHLRLSATANGGSTTEDLTIPAITARTDTYVRIALANPESDTAIISVALEYNANSGANTIWLSKIQAVDHDSATYVKIPKQGWRIDREANDVVMESRPHGLLKITGGSNPASMSTGATVATVPESYLVAKEMALLLPKTTREELQIVQSWEVQAQLEMGKFPAFVDARKVA